MSYIKINKIEDMWEWRCAIWIALSWSHKWNWLFWSKTHIKGLVEEWQERGYSLSIKLLEAYDERLWIETEYEPLNLSNPTDFDISLAEKYIKKYNNSIDRGLEFSLTLTDLKTLLKKKTCYYTGVPFNEENFMTLDRIDGTEWYTKQNTVACTNLVNNVKNALFENPASSIRIEKKLLLKMLTKI